MNPKGSVKDEKENLVAITVLVESPNHEMRSGRLPLSLHLLVAYGNGQYHRSKIGVCMIPQGMRR